LPDPNLAVYMLFLVWRIKCLKQPSLLVLHVAWD
jgi:hypothetical protein